MQATKAQSLTFEVVELLHIGARQATKTQSLTFEVVDCRNIGRREDCHHWIEVAYIREECRRHLRGFMEHQEETGYFRIVQYILKFWLKN